MEAGDSVEAGQSIDKEGEGGGEQQPSMWSPCQSGGDVDQKESGRFGGDVRETEKAPAR